MGEAILFKPPMMQNTGIIDPSTVRPFTDLGAQKRLPKRDILRQAGSISLDAKFALPEIPKGGLAPSLTNQSDRPSTVNNARPSGLPPTPPMHLQDASGAGGELTATCAKKQVVGDYVTPHSDVGTPVNQRSPPTPDSTPPREQEMVLGLHPPMNQPYLSSRTDSFETAREDQPPSDDEDARPEMTFLNGAHDDYDDLTPLAQSKELPLGLDIPPITNVDGADEDKTPTAERTQIEFGTSDRNWDTSNRTQGVNHGRSQTEGLTIPKGREKQSTSSALAEDASNPILADTVLADTTSDLYERIGSSLRERIERNRENADRPSTLRFAEEISWPTTMVSVDPDEGDRATDNKRFSGMSSTSTVIEAYVVDIHRPRRRPLRHVGKTANLRARISSAPASVSSPGATRRPKHRLVHKKSNEDMKRASMASDHSPILEPRDELPRNLTEPIPVMVIPQQRQSLSKSRPESTPTVDSSSPSASLESRRNTGADGHGYFDLPLRRKKRIGGTFAAAEKFEGNGDEDLVVMNSSRRPTLSVANSHDASSTTSPMSMTEAAGAGMLSRKTTSNRVADSGLTQGRDGRVGSMHLSAPITPYSQLSTNSTSEALEVSEATAISIYPHHNNSLLVVQQHTRPASQAYEQVPVSGVPKSPPKVFAVGSSVVSTSQTAQESPQPPALQIIPPTPDVLSPTAELDRQLGGGQVGKSGKLQNVRAGRALKRVKRALSNRRYSDSFLAPFTLFKGVDESTQTTSNHHHRRPSLGERKDSKLSPFWRPRGFWDDLEVSDEDVQDEFLDRGRVELFERPISRTRHRSEEDEDREHYGSRRRQHSNDNAKIAQSGASGRRVHTLPALGVQIEFVGWKGVQRRLKEIKVGKKTKAKECERERIKGRISPPTAINPTLV